MDTLTSRPLSQPPCTATLERTHWSAVGVIKVNAGLVLSRRKLRLAEPTRPSAFVWEAIKFLMPSPTVKAMLAENNPLLHAVLAGET